MTQVGASSSCAASEANERPRLECPVLALHRFSCHAQNQKTTRHPTYTGVAPANKPTTAARTATAEPTSYAITMTYERRDARRSFTDQSPRGSRTHDARDGVISPCRSARQNDAPRSPLSPARRLRDLCARCGAGPTSRSERVAAVMPALDRPRVAERRRRRHRVGPQRRPDSSPTLRLRAPPKPGPRRCRCP